MEIVFGALFIVSVLSASMDADAGHSTFIQDCFENQSRNPLLGNWGTDSAKPYTDIKGDPVDHRDEIQVPEGWKWTTDWTSDINRACDEEGYY